MKYSDELIFEVTPRIDTTSHGVQPYRVDLTALRDGHRGRSNVDGYRGSKDFGRRLGLATKERLQDRRLSKSDASLHKTATNHFMRFFDEQGFPDDIEPSFSLLREFANYIERIYGAEIPSEIPDVYGTIENLFKEMSPGMDVPRRRFVRADIGGPAALASHESIKEIQRRAEDYSAARAAMADFKLVQDRISIGRAEAMSDGEDLLQVISDTPDVGPMKACTQERVSRLLYRQLNLQPITASEFESRFNIRPDQYCLFPAPGRAATAGASLMKAGLVGAYRWVLPTATDLMGPVVLTLENTGWNMSTILVMKSSMVTRALSTARDGVSKIYSWKGRAGRPEETSIVAGPGSLLDVLATVQEWNAPLRSSIIEELSTVNALLRQSPVNDRREELERRQSWLENMKDRLWLCLGSCPIGVTRLKEGDLSAKSFRAMFESNKADLAKIGKYNCREARLNYLARAEGDRNVQVEVLKAIARHGSICTTLNHYADRLPGALKRDEQLAKFSASIMSHA